jgi:hypothetical protein
MHDIRGEVGITILESGESPGYAADAELTRQEHILGLRLAFVADDTVEATPGCPEFCSLESRRREKSRQEAHSGLIISYPTCVALFQEVSL